MSNNACRGKTAYIWISVDPAKEGPTLEVVVIAYKFCNHIPSAGRYSKLAFCSSVMAVEFLTCLKS